MSMAQALPCITVYPRYHPLPPSAVTPLEALANLFAASQGAGQDGLRDMTGRTIATLVAEGRSYAASPEGRRWMQAIESSGLAQKGWMLWNMLDVDRLVADSDPLGDSPVDLLADLVAQLGQTSLADLVTLMSDLSLEGWRNAGQ
jgi:hypothetical protein